MTTIYDARSQEDLSAAIYQTGWNCVTWSYASDSVVIGMVEAPYTQPCEEYPGIAKKQIVGRTEDEAMERFLSEFENEHGPQKWSPRLVRVVRADIKVNVGPIDPDSLGTGKFVVEVQGETDSIGSKFWQIESDDRRVVAALKRAYTEKALAKIADWQLQIPYELTFRQH